MSNAFIDDAQEPVKSSSMEAMETANRIGISGIGFANFRGQNTILKGGFLDNKSSTGVGARSRAKFRPFTGNSMTPGIRPGAEQFVGGKNIFGQTTKRGRKMEAKNAKALSLGQPGKTGSFKRFRRGNLTADPRAFMRNPNLSGFGAHSAGFASPNAGGALASISNQGAKLFGKGKDAPLFSGGIFSRTGAVTKLERRAARGRSTARGDLNLARIAKMNAPGSLVRAMPGAVTNSNISPYAGRAYAGIVAPSTLNAGRSLSYEATALGGLVDKGAAGQALTVGERRYLTVGGVSGTKSKSFMNRLLMDGGGPEMRTAMGTSGVKTFRTYNDGALRGQTSSGIRFIQMTDEAERVIRPLGLALEKSASLTSLAGNRGLVAARGSFDLATQISDKGIIKSLGMKGSLQAAKLGGRQVGLRVAGAAFKAAVPGINLIFAADMAYQLAKLGGLAVKGAINFGKAGMKSMQGNISGGVFGDYKDNEVAATSRARGVAAIQNSRMNARSLLGAEARNDGCTLWVGYNER